MSQELAVAQPEAPNSGLARAARPRGVQLHTLDDYFQFADIALRAGLAPKGMSSPESVFIALQSGAELGLSPMQSLQNIGVINGKPAPYGDALPAIIQASGLCEVFDEWFEENGVEIADIPYLQAKDFPDHFTAVTVMRRRGRSRDRVSKFSVADAKRAGLWAKPGPWTQYPQRMLRARSMTFCARDEFADVTKGFVSYEELRDIPEEPKSSPRATKEAPRKAAVVAVEEEVEAEVDESDLDVFDLQSKSIDELNERFEEIKASGGKDSPDAAEYKEVFYQIKVRLARGEKPTPKVAPEPVSAIKAKQQEAIQVTEEEAQEIEDIFGSGSGELVNAEIIETPAIEMIQPQQKQAIMARARKLFGKDDYQSRIAAEIESNYEFAYDTDSTKLTVEELTVKQASDLLIGLQTRITQAATPKEDGDAA